MLKAFSRETANSCSSEPGCRGWDWYGSTATTTTRKNNRTNRTKDHWSPRWECHPHSVYLLIVGTSAIKQLPVEFLVNTGTAVLVVKYSVWNEISQKKPTKTLRPTQRSLVGVQEKPLTIRGTADLTIQLCGEEFPTQVIVVESLSSCAILGQDFLQDCKCLIDMEENVS